MSLTKDQELGLRNALESDETISLSFVKANGNIRNMICVISPEVCGDVYEHSENEQVNDGDPNNQLVWEPALKQWRKFKYSNVIQWVKAVEV